MAGVLRRVPSNKGCRVETTVAESKPYQMDIRARDLKSTREDIWRVQPLYPNLDGFAHPPRPEKLEGHMIQSQYINEYT